MDSLPQPKRTLKEVDALLTPPGSPTELEEKVIKGRRVRVYKNLSPSVFADKVYIVYENERLTYAEAHAKVAHVAALLHARGVRKGDRVAIAMRNLPEWPIAWWAAHSLGAVAVAVNAWLSPDAFFHCLSLTKPTAVFVDEEREKVLSGKIAKLRRLGAKVLFSVRSKSGAGDKFERLEDALPRCKERTLPSVRVDPEDPATVFFTSGTTSLPKGVLSTQRQYMSNRFNTIFGGARAVLRRGESLPVPSLDAPQKSVLLTVPLFHVMGNQSFLQLLTAIGGKVVLMHKFSAPSAAALLRSEGVTVVGGVPNMIQQVMDAIDQTPQGWEGLKVEGVSFGGGPASGRLAEETQKRLPPAGTGASQGYGLTEVNSVATGFAGEDYYRRPTSCGLAPPAVSLKIIPPDAPQPASAAPSLPVGEVGEICIHGPNVAEGYYGDEEATGKAFDKEGWFRSGDLGYLDADGFLYCVDRAKDIIIRSGENISSVAVEYAISQHPAVKEVAVVPVPCDVHGEQVAAAVVLHPSSHPSRAQGECTSSTLTALVASSLPKHCVPALVVFPAECNRADGELPKNPTGKVLKAEVKKVVGAEWEKSGLGRKVQAKL
ncbi:hypothetical protein JCM6882_004029 [Rhodosporidiobolus microsporus]